jgi:hypothetical protein
MNKLFNTFRFFTSQKGRKNNKIAKKIHFIHRRITENSGDLQCGYYRYVCDYFNKYTICVHDIWAIDYTIINKHDFILIGGGGLLNNGFGVYINSLFKFCKNIIIYSAGFNYHYNTNNGDKIVYDKIVFNWDNFKLIGIRDYNHPSGLRYVPCATCLSPLFDNLYKNKREIGIIKHLNKSGHGVKWNISSNDYETIDNSASFEQIIKFIGESETIITNTYHATYWSMLMNKKVILEAPFSDKFEYLKYKPSRYSGDLKNDAFNAKTHPNFLKECREINADFLKDLMNVINA